MAEENGNKVPKVNYPANSQRAKETEKEAPKVEPRVSQVTSGKVVERKKPIGKKIAETFAGDDMQSVGSYILFDVIIPATKNLIADMVEKGINRALFGDGARSASRISNRAGHSSYNKMYTGSTRSDLDRPGGGRPISDRGRRNHEFEEIVLDDRSEAAQVIEALQEVIETYDVATVTDLYDLVGITGNYVDNQWGWDDLRGAEVRSVREGYLLSLPKPKPID